MNKKNTKKYRVRSDVFKVVGIILICVSIWLLAGVIQDIYSMIELRQRSEVAAEELEKLKAENAELISQKDKLEDDNYVQSYARNNYMFSKDGEQIFFLPSDSDEDISEDIPTGTPSDKTQDEEAAESEVAPEESDTSQEEAES